MEHVAGTEGVAVAEFLERGVVATGTEPALEAQRRLHLMVGPDLTRAVLRGQHIQKGVCLVRQIARLRRGQGQRPTGRRGGSYSGGPLLRSRPIHRSGGRCTRRGWRVAPARATTAYRICLIAVMGANCYTHLRHSSGRAEGDERDASASRAEPVTSGYPRC